MLKNRKVYISNLYFFTRKVCVGNLGFLTLTLTFTKYTKFYKYFLYFTKKYYVLN